MAVKAACMALQLRRAMLTVQVALMRERESQLSFEDLCWCINDGAGASKRLVFASVYAIGPKQPTLAPSSAANSHHLSEHLLLTGLPLDRRTIVRCLMSR